MNDVTPTGGIGIPCATSTVNRKKKPDKSPQSSLGLLALTDQSVDLIPVSDRTRKISTASAELQHQRELSRKSISRPRLSSRYFKPSDLPASFTAESLIGKESTVTESDLLRSKCSLGENESFKPGEISTPRESLASLKSDEVLEMYKGLSLGEFCSEMKEKLSFVSGEKAKERLKADEGGLLNGNGMDFSKVANDMSKSSIGEYFMRGSEDLQELLPIDEAKSPAKTGPPLALVDDVNMTSDRASSLSLSSIGRILSEMTVFDSPNQMANALYQKVKKGSSKENRPLDVITEVPSASNSRGSDIESRKSTLEPPKSSLGSVRSGSSVSNLPDGKLPLETSKVCLSWPCVKLGQSVPQSFVFRNKCQSKVRLIASVSGNDFKLVKDQSGMETTNKLKVSLHGMESKTITVVFYSTKLGAAYGKLCFLPENPNLQVTKKQGVGLFAYAGQAKINITNVAKDVRNKYLLHFGDINKITEIEKKMTVRNNGNLPGFVYARYQPKMSYSFLKVEITPNKFALQPTEQQNITVKYVKTKEDLNYMSNASYTPNVLEIGTIDLLTGAEALRGRIRKLSKLAEKEKLQIKSTTTALSKPFLNESIPQDINNFSEPITELDSLCQQLSLKEILVTVDYDPDSTIVNMSGDSTAFFTLCGDISETTMKSDEEKILTVLPVSMILLPPNKKRDNCLVTNLSGKSVKFKVENRTGLSVEPKSGSLGAGEKVLLKVDCCNVSNGIYEFCVVCDGKSVSVKVEVMGVGKIKNSCKCN